MVWAWLPRWSGVMHSMGRRAGVAMAASEHEAVAVAQQLRAQLDGGEDGSGQGREASPDASAVRRPSQVAAAISEEEWQAAVKGIRTLRATRPAASAAIASLVVACTLQVEKSGRDAAKVTRLAHVQRVDAAEAVHKLQRDVTRAKARLGEVQQRCKELDETVMQANKRIDAGQEERRTLRDALDQSLDETREGRKAIDALKAARDDALVKSIQLRTTLEAAVAEAAEAKQAVTSLSHVQEELKAVKQTAAVQHETALVQVDVAEKEVARLRMAVTRLEEDLEGQQDVRTKERRQLMERVEELVGQVTGAKQNEAVAKDRELSHKARLDAVSARESRCNMRSSDCDERRCEVKVQ